jgi:hypothetical protein
MMMERRLMLSRKKLTIEDLPHPEGEKSENSL